MPKLKLSKIVTSCGLVCKKQAYPAIIVSQDAPNSGVSAYSGPPTEYNTTYRVQSLSIPFMPQPTDTHVTFQLLLCTPESCNPG